MRSLPISLLAAALLIGGCASLPDQWVRFPGLSDCPETSPPSLLANGDRFGPGSSTHSLQCALSVARNSNAPEVQRSALPSRLALHLAEREPDSARKEALAREGVQWAEQALRQGAERDGAVHYYLAANLGLAVHQHPLQAADSVSRLEQELQTAVRLSPGVDDGGPLRLLGMLYLKAPSWPTGIGDGDKALGWLQKAVDQYPQHPLNHLFHAEALWEVDEKGAAARSALEEGLRQLRSGPWGYNKTIWGKEFSQVAQELDTPLR